MTQRDYEKLTLKQMQEKRWKTLRTLQNGHMKIPEGTEVRITNKCNGLTLSGEKCETCGVSVYISKVSPLDVQVIASWEQDK
jgi:hypothetical protein